MKTGLFLLLLFLFAMAGCAKKPAPLTGSLLLESIRVYLDSPSDSMDFDADPAEAAQCLQKILVEPKTGRPGQDTLFLTCRDGKPRALGVHAPSACAAGKPMPLLLWLHGGVNGTRQNRGAEVAHYFARESDSLCFIYAAPSGERGATWYDPVGAAFIQDAVRALKRRYPVDENRVILAGVSDGGTGCVAAANLYPDPFAGYIVCSGYPPLLASFGLPCFVDNLKRTPWLFVHSGKDQLYPADTVQALMAEWTRAGVPLTFHFYPRKPHGLDYMPEEKPSLMEFIAKTRRNPSPDSIMIRAFYAQRFRWLGLDSLDGQTATISAVRKGNTVSVRTEGVGRFSLYPAAPWAAPNDTLRITLNGNPLSPVVCCPSTPFLLAFAKNMMDPGFLPWCQLSFDVR